MDTVPQDDSNQSFGHGAKLARWHINLKGLLDARGSFYMAKATDCNQLTPSPRPVYGYGKRFSIGQDKVNFNGGSLY